MSLRRLATIDLGTNTVRLLVVEVGPGGWRRVDEAQQVTRLGEGRAPSGRLGEGPMERTARVVASFAARARAAGAGAIRIVATSAVREASNGAAFAGRVEAASGAPVEVIDGEREAHLTVRGVLAGLPDAGRRLLVLDVGGGSTEFVLAEGGEVRAVASLRLGVVSVAERYPFPGPVDRSRYRAMQSEIAGQLARELPPDITGARLPEVVGTAGTVTTLAALDLGLARYEPERVHGHRLSRGAIAALAERLGALDVAGRAALPCVEPGRADLLVPGAAIVLAALDATRARAVRVSDWGLREGLVADAISNPAI